MQRLPSKFRRGIRFKLTLFVLLLITGSTFSIAFLVMQIMDRSLLHSLIQRGSAITQAAASPAGYSILMNDLLALDNLTAQIEKAQQELEYVAILDLDQNILAHNDLERVDDKLQSQTKTVIESREDLSVTRVWSDGVECLEFSRPIFFAGKQVGHMIVGINILELVAAKTAAHRDIILIATTTTILGLIGTILLSTIMTRPVERLTEAVSKLHKGEHVVDIPVRGKDELGILTQNFNQMARMIQEQKESLQNYATDLESSYGDIVRILAAALDARDNYTYGHSARVAQLALGLGEKLQLGKEAMHELELACLLHDIGKIHVPDAILNKAEPLDQDEHQEIIQHPVLGSQILELAPSLHKYIPTVKHHHERYDGTGYPDQLRGDSIPLYAQIVALADTYDAMTSSRPYREGLCRQDAINEILSCSGSQFNPRLIKPFIETAQVFPDHDPNLEAIRKTESRCAS
jgi:putative nucleotidyltransferase with HDIG domain